MYKRMLHPPSFLLRGLATGRPGVFAKFLQFRREALNRARIYLAHLVELLVVHEVPGLPLLMVQ